MAKARPTPRDLRFGNDPGDGDLVPEGGCSLPAVSVAFDHAVQAWTEWMASRRLRGRVSSATYRQYVGVVRTWATWLLERQIRQPTPEDAAAFLAWGQQMSGWSYVTVLSYRTALRSLYAWVAKNGHGEDIAAGLMAPPVPPPAAAPELLPSHVRQLIAAISGQTLRAHRDRAIIALLFAGSLEPISLHRARLVDFDVDSGVLHHQPRGARQATATVTLNGVARTLMRRYLDALGKRHSSAPLIVAIHGMTGTAIQRSLSTLSIRLVVRRTLDVVYGTDPAVNPRTPRRTSRSPQRAASRALRRSGLAILSKRTGSGVSDAMAQRGVDSNLSRFRRALASLTPITKNF
jgi:site-specific recombinase XerD